MRAALIAALVIACGAPPATSVSVKPVRPPRTSLSVLGSTLCAITEGGVRCWGYGYGPTPTPVDLPGATRFIEGLCVDGTPGELRCVNVQYRTIVVIDREPLPEMASDWLNDCYRTSEGRWRCLDDPDDDAEEEAEIDEEYAGFSMPPEDGPRGHRFEAPLRIAHGRTTCAIEASGRTHCRGRPSSAMAFPPGVRDLAMADSRLCLLDAERRVRCTPFGTKARFETIALSPEAGPVVRLLARGGWPHHCALHRGGAVSCWAREGEPFAFGVPPRTVELVGGGFPEPTWCARTSDARVFCRGDGRAEQLGALAHGSEAVRAPVRVALDGVRSFALGAFRGAAVTDRGAYRWGRIDDLTEAWTPIPWVGAEDAVEVRLAGENRCARRPNGDVVCDGPIVALRNAEGERATELLDGRDEPRVATSSRIQELGGASQIAVGPAHVCGIVGGIARCTGPPGLGRDVEWGPTDGLPERGLLGPSPPIDDAVDVAVVGFTTCVHRANREVWCWGGAEGRDARRVGVADAMSLGYQAVCLGDARRLRCYDLERDDPRPALDVAADARALEVFDDLACVRSSRQCWRYTPTEDISGHAEPWAMADGVEAPPDRVAWSGFNRCWQRGDEVFCTGETDHGALGDGVELVSSRWIEIDLRAGE